MRFGSKRRERAATEPSPSWPESADVRRRRTAASAGRVTAGYNDSEYYNDPQDRRALERRSLADLGFVLGLPELLEEGFDLIESRCQHDVAASQIVFDDVVILESRQVIVD